MAAAGTSALITSAAASVASLTALTSAGPASRFAPGATVMMFSPALVDRDHGESGGHAPHGAHSGIV